LETFGDQVYDDLLRTIVEEAGAGVADPVGGESGFADEEAAIEAFLTRHGRSFVPGARGELLEAVLAFAAGRDRRSRSADFLIVRGEPGCGKSALLAQVIQQMRARYPRTLVVPHLVGSSAASPSLRSALRHLCSSLAKAAGASLQMPEEIGALQRLFPRL